MKKKSVLSLLKSIAVVLCLVFVPSLFSGCSFGETDSTYSISGTVIDDVSGDPVENAVISCDKGEFVTDENGKYTISGLVGSIVISPSAEGYCFEVVSKKITSSSDDANFVASKIYTVSGYTKSNDTAVSNVSVILQSLAGTFSTSSDENGYFVASGVAGTTTVSCFDENGTEFYTATATIDSPEIEVNTTTNFTLNFEFDIDEADVDYSDINVLIDGEKWNIQEASSTLKNVYCGTEVQISSNACSVCERKCVVDTANQTTTIVASKLFDLTGQVSSGETPLEGAYIYIDGVKKATTNSNGYFSVSGLYSNLSVTVSYENFEFEEQTANFSNTNLIFKGTKSVTFNFYFDYETEIAIKDGGVSISSETLKLDGVSLGEKFEISSNNYYIENSQIEIDENDTYLVSCNAIYSANVSLSDDTLAGLVTIFLDGEEIAENNLTSLYGSHTISASYSNYVFDEFELNFDNKNAVLSFIIPLDVSVSVASGDIKILDYNVFVNGELSQNVISDGVISLTVKSGDVLTFDAEGFDVSPITIQNGTESGASFVAEATYSISGTLVCGSSVVKNATLNLSGTQTNFTKDYIISSGSFEISGLSGTLELSATKDNYSFDSRVVCKNTSDIQLNSSYSLSGTESYADLKGISNLTVELRNLATNEISYTETDENGSYSFSGLVGNFWIYIYNNSMGDTSLMPQYYSVSEGGDYYFSLTGFEVSGKVETGGLAVENAKVVATGTTTSYSVSTYTDENGEYSFALLISECTISVSKDGYEFAVSSNSTSQENSDIAGIDSEINFEGTYTVAGYALSSNSKISGVQFLVGNSTFESDENGYFEISGLSGETQIEILLDGYTFDCGNSIAVFEANLEMTIECSLEKTLTVLSGGVQVCDFDVYVNGNFYANSGENNTISIGVKVDDSITIQKTGYEFETVIADAQNRTYEIQATYKISGTIVSGSKTISGASIVIDGKTYTANSVGVFEISGLSGELQVCISKTGFNEASFEISSSDLELDINLTYLVSGYVYIGSNLLSGVRVVCTDESGETLSATTGTNGKFEFQNVEGYYTITCVKTNYLFETDSYSNLFGSQEFKINALFSVSGTVKSGDLAVSGALVEILVQNSGKTVKVYTDTYGKFSVSGLSGVVSITISKDGYDGWSLENVSDVYSNSINLTYTISLEIATTGVKISVDGETYIASTGSTYIEISGLSGKVLIALEKDGNSFSPYDEFYVEEPYAYTVENKPMFNVSGTVTTETGGIAVSNVALVLGSKTATTDSNGTFTFKDVIGGGTLTFADTECFSFSSTISESNYSNISITVADSDYGYYMYKTGYANLDSAASVQIYGSGTVSGTVAGYSTKQSVSSVYKRDQYNNIAKQNLNYGDKVAGIDPRVSLLVIGNSSAYYTQKLTGDSITETGASHTASGLSKMDASTIKSTYGSSPTEYSSYSVSKSCVTSLTKNSDGTFKLVMSLSTTQPNYATQIGSLSPGSTFDAFTSLQHTYTFDANGFITSLYTYEIYTVKQTISLITVTATITSAITYTFKTDSLYYNLTSNLVDWSSDSAIASSLTESSQSLVSTTSVATSLNASVACDVVSTLIYGA